MHEASLHRKAQAIRESLGSHPHSRPKASARASRAGSGLLKAAETFRKGDISAFAADDRREIEREIEEVTRRNRISAGSEAFVMRPRRRGFVFPLVVNLIAILVTSCLVYVISRVVGKAETATGSATTAVASAEGILLRELKLDSESRLQEKDNAIADIRAKLGSLDKERADLAGSIEARIKQREAELKAGLQAELEAEKRRLESQGLSEGVLQARLKVFEGTKSAESARQLAAEQAKAAAEKAAAEASFQKLKDEYQKSMASLGDERQRIQDAAKKREDEIRASMDAKNQELETRSAAAEASLAQARDELAALTEQRTKAQASEERILGLYAVIRAALREGRFADAASASQALGSYLEDPGLPSDASRKERRAADLFVAQTIATYARSELERTRTDATSLLRQAELLSSAREASAAAGAALKAGNAALAAAKYREALEKVPEILAAYRYFSDREQAVQDERRARLAEALAGADRAYRAGDAKGSAALYSDAIAYLPIDAAARNMILARLAEFGAAASDSARASSDTKAARQLLADASRDASEGNWDGAIARYISLVSTYPRAEQVPSALAGIEAGKAAMLRAAAAEASAEKAAADARLAAVSAELERTRQALEQARGKAGADSLGASKTESELRSRIADLEKSLADEARKTSEAAATANAAVEAAASAAKDGEIERLKAEVERLVDEADRAQADAAGIRDDAARYRSLVDSYSRFVATEGTGPDGPRAPIASLSGLYSFLGVDAVAQAFPGLKEKVSAYQAEAQKEALEAFPSDAAEIVRQVSSYKDAASRNVYFASRRAVYAASGNALMVNFIDALRRTTDS